MSVRKRTWTSGGREKSAWAATVTDQNAKRRQKSFKTQKAAKDWEVQTEQEKKLGIYTPESETITVKKGSDLWLEKGRARRACALDNLALPQARQKSDQSAARQHEAHRADGASD